jgi:hypothetical protein
MGMMHGSRFMQDYHGNFREQVKVVTFRLRDRSRELYIHEE